MDSAALRFQSPPIILEGRIIATKGPLLTAQMPLACLGAQVEISVALERTIKGIITSFSGEYISIAPLEAPAGIMIGARVRSNGKPPTTTLTTAIEGAILGASGESLVPSSSPASVPIKLPLNSPPPAALSRNPISAQLITGISAIDGFSPIGIGQRLSLSAPAGTGKSTLLGMITRNSAVDHTVIALIGERGREVKEFIDEVLGENGLPKSTIVVSTSDEPPIRKLCAAETAFSICEHLRNQGKNVLLIVDSLTRLARAMRDVGLANGEIPVRQGYPASVLVSLPRLLERAGNNQHGSITAIFSLLQEEEGGNDYLSHEVASLLDGHLVLDPRLAEQGHFPALDITRSLSRLTTKLIHHDQIIPRQKILRSLSRLYRERDLLLLGGTPDKELCSIIAAEERVNELLRQQILDSRSLSDTNRGLFEVAESL